MLSVRRASSLFRSITFLSLLLTFETQAMPVIGEPQRLHASVGSEDIQRKITEPLSDAKALGAAEARETPQSRASATPFVAMPSATLLRLDQQTLILVVAGFAAALSLMARLR